jgi:hypothetical protein
MDDVLNACTMPVMKAVGCDVGDFDNDKFPLDGEYDIIKAVATLKGEAQMDPVEFWDGISDALWEGLPKSPGCDWILNRAADLVGRENVHVATAPTSRPGAHAGKVRWITSILPEWMHRQYVITPQKWLLGRPGWLLIDDALENVTKWEAMGGDAILLPMPWNPLHWESDALAYLNGQLIQLFEEY